MPAKLRTLRTVLLMSAVVLLAESDLPVVSRSLGFANKLSKVCLDVGLAARTSRPLRSRAWSGEDVLPFCRGDDASGWLSGQAADNICSISCVNWSRFEGGSSLRACLDGESGLDGD